MQIDEEQARFWDALHILLNIYINTEDTLYVIGMLSRRLYIIRRDQLY